MENARPRFGSSHGLPHPNEYVLALHGEFRDWAFDEERAPEFKGKWRNHVFQVDQQVPVDLELGTGNGFHFAHWAAEHPERCLVGIEMKFKPLIQSIRRALREGAKNARMLRYDAAFLTHLFANNELNHVFIHFPDPWEKKKQKKHRLIQPKFLAELHQLQRPGSMIDFKTDSADYFFEAVEKFKTSQYQLVGYSEDLHNSEYADKNFVTHFENIFIRQNLPIHWCRLLKK